MLKLVGHRLSPYVRKVRLVLAHKGLEYDHDEISPMEVDDEYREKYHPMGKIPVLVDGNLTLPDSSIICQYLEEKYQQNPLLPKDPKDKAWVLWLEEYADTTVMANIGGPFFFNRVLKPMFFKQKPDEILLASLMKEEIPKVLAYLDKTLKEPFCSGDDLTIADLTFAAHFRAGFLGRFDYEKGDYTNVSSYISRLMEQETVAKLFAEEDAFITEMRSN